MKKISFTLVLIFLLLACNKDDDNTQQTTTFEDFSGQVDNRLMSIKTSDGREVNAYFSKPVGTNVDIVLALHGGTAELEASIDATVGYNFQPDGGRQFLEMGYAVLSVGYTEYEINEEGNEEKSDRGFKEFIDVLSATDYILNDSLVKHNVNINKVFAFGHSRGGNNALLMGIERPLDGVMAAEAPLDWVKTKVAIDSMIIPGTFEEIQLFNESVSEWTDDDFIKYSPGLRLQEFQSPFLIISGELDPAVLISIAEDVRDDYLTCNTTNQCIDGGEFVFHPLGHTDWSDSISPNTLEAIQNFINNN